MSEAMVNQGVVLACQGLGLNLSGVDILCDINLRFERGKIHAIVGPNGGGKTSLIRCLLGQMAHTGIIASDLPENAAVGYVPQFLDFDKTLPLTVFDFLTMANERYRPSFLRPLASTKNKIDELLQRVGLEGQSQHKMGSLSGGERQRVLFAQALIPQPQLLVLDEPSTSLDQDGEAILLELLQEAKDNATTVLWIAHDLTQVKQVADSVSGVMKNLRFHGHPKEVLLSTNLFELFRQETVA